MASAYAEEIGALYVETSAKEDICIHDMFTQLSMCFLFWLFSFCVARLLFN